MRVESIYFRGNSTERPNSAVRIALTQVSGLEMDKVIYIPEEVEEEVQRITSEITELLERHGNIGLAGVSRAIWGALAKSDTKLSE